MNFAAPQFPDLLLASNRNRGEINTLAISHHRWQEGACNE